MDERNELLNYLLAYRAEYGCSFDVGTHVDNLIGIIQWELEGEQEAAEDA